MTTDRIKEIQAETAYPNSTSVQQALLKVWNECEQEQVKNCSIPFVVGQSEQLVCDYKYHNRDITTNGECTKCESHKWR